MRLATGFRPATPTTVPRVRVEPFIDDQQVVLSGVRNEVIVSQVVAPRRSADRLTPGNSTELRRRSASTSALNPLRNDTEEPDPVATQLETSWDDVLTSMVAAKDDYDSKLGKTKLRGLARNKDLINTLQSLTEMIPEENGLSVLRGGLKIIFETVQRRIENRDKILSAFQDIPLIFSKACDAHRLYRDDDALPQLVRNLYDILNSKIPELIEILNRRQKAAFHKKIWKQYPGQEASAIDGCLEEIRRASQRVSDRSEYLRGRDAHQNLQETRYIGAKIDQTYAGVQELWDGLDGIRRQQIAMEEKRLEQDQRHAQHTRDMRESYTRQLQAVFSDFKSEIRSEIEGILYEHMPSVNLLHGGGCGGQYLPAPGFHGGPPPLLYLQVPHPPSLHVTYDEILSAVDFDASCLTNDLEEVIRNTEELGPIAVSRANWLLVTPRVEEWMRTSTGESDLLLVDSHLFDYTVGKVSPISTFVASFVSMVKTRPQFSVLYHFCGLHSHPSDPLAGPSGLLRSLVAQLVLELCQINPEGTVILPTVNGDLMADLLLAPSSPSPSARRRQHPQYDMVGLCVLFRELLAQFPEDMPVFCVLDDIPEFETSLEGWVDQLCEVVMFLQGLVNDPGRRPPLKVLLTAACRSITVFRQVEPRDHISLEGGDEGPGGMDEMMF